MSNITPIRPRLATRQISGFVTSEGWVPLGTADLTDPQVEEFLAGIQAGFLDGNGGAFIVSGAVFDTRAFAGITVIPRAIEGVMP